MAYRKKRRAKYTWLPVLGSELESTTPGLYINKWGRDFNITAAPESLGICRPLTADLPRDEDLTTADPGVLSDSIGQEWFLRRIVGKLFIRWGANAGGDSATNIKIAAGFFVARADHIDGDIPAGGDSSWTGNINPGVYNMFDPSSNATIREPWIWRRTWIIGNPDIDTDTSWPKGLAPYSNATYGSALDGPHIDAKTMRRISNDDRLWFAMSATTWPFGSSGGGNIIANLDIRLLGALRRARNRGVF